MNNIRATKAINDRELKLGIKASWHDDYKDSAYVYVGGLDTGLTEGDIITIFSQYGEPVDINLPKQKAPPPNAENSAGPSASTGSRKPKSRGFCFLMYENQLSTNLAVDNLNGAVVLGRTLRVDHCKNYKQLERTQDGKMVERDADLGERLNARPELHAQSQIQGGDNASDEDEDIDPEDPMAEYLLEERRKRREKRSRKRVKDDSHGERADKHESRKHRKKDHETKEERSARKAAKKIKKLLKEVGPSSSRGNDRRDNGRYDERE